MDWKVSFFVRTATRTASGWVIDGNRRHAEVHKYAIAREVLR